MDEFSKDALYATFSFCYFLVQLIQNASFQFPNRVEVAQWFIYKPEGWWFNLQVSRRLSE